MRALLFPGQGSQRVGMGKELAAAFASARATYEEADEALGWSVSSLCFEGPEAELIKTENTQPAILTTSIAVMRALEQERGLSFDIAAGHSLGEWTALVAAGALRFADAVALVHLRGRAMQEAVPAGVGSMAAILGLDLAAVQAVCEEAAQGQVVSPANLNGGGQIVISGHAAAVERAVVKAKEAGAKRAMPLKVSAPFHCALMEPAARAVEEALAGIEIGEMRVPVVANVDAELNRDPGRVKDLLVRQVTQPVRWEEVARAVVAAGATGALELGAAAVLGGLCRRIVPELAVSSVATPDDIEKLELS